MPYLRFKGFSEVFLEEITPQVVDEFCGIVQIPQEIVKIELLPYQIITNTPLSVEILMFQRSQEIHDAVAPAFTISCQNTGTGTYIFSS